MLKRFFTTKQDITTHLADSMILGLQMDRFQQLARLLQGMDYAEAAKAGVHPNELDAIRAMRLTGIDSVRVDELVKNLAEPE